MLFETDATSKKKKYIEISQVTVSRIQLMHTHSTVVRCLKDSCQLTTLWTPVHPFVSMEINAQIGVTRVPIFSDVCFLFLLKSQARTSEA